MEDDSSYFVFLKEELALIDNWEYKSHGRLITTAYFRVNPNLIGSFYEKNLPINISASEYNEELFSIYYVLTGMFREHGDLDKANEYYEALSLYSKNTKKSVSEKSFVRQSVKLASHEAVLAGIGKNVEKGLEITQRMLDQSYAINDTSLIVLSNYFKMEFLIPQGKIDEYIALAEESLELEELSQKESEFTYSLTSNLIDGYIYKGVEKEKVWLLLKNLYYSGDAYKSLTYPFFIKALRIYDVNSTYRKKSLNCGK